MSDEHSSRGITSEIPTVPIGTVIEFSGLDIHAGSPWTAAYSAEKTAVRDDDADLSLASRERQALASLHSVVEAMTPVGFEAVRLRQHRAVICRALIPAVFLARYVG